MLRIRKRKGVNTLMSMKTGQYNMLIAPSKKAIFPKVFFILSVAVLSLSKALLWADYPVVTVVPELTLERIVHKGPFHLDELERNRYFRSYHPPGMFSDERNRELEEIGAMPARGTYRIELPDPVHDLTEITRVMSEGRVHSSHDPRHYWKIYKAIPEGGAAPHAIAHGRYHPWMREGLEPLHLESSAAEDWEAIAVGNVPRVELYEYLANGVVGLYEHWKAKGVDYPEFYTVQNEPIWQWRTADLAAFHNRVAERMREAHPEVLVGGPCYAWPYPQADWRGWANPQQFIALSGGHLGFYDIHFYSKGDWALPPEPRWQERAVDHPSLYRSQRLGVGAVWDFGRLEGYLDLWNAFHLTTHDGKWIPMVISEFGRQGIFPQFGPWTNDFKPFIFMSTVVRMWMTFIDRPDIQLAVPFILGESDLDYAPRRGMAIYTRPRAALPEGFEDLAARRGQGLVAELDGPFDPGLEPTRFLDFYRFFTDIRGKRIPVEIASKDTAAVRRLFVLAFRDNDEAFLWIHNGGAYPENPVMLDLESIHSQWGESIRDIGVKRMYFAGPIPDPHASGDIDGRLHIDDPIAYQPLTGRYLRLSGEETAIIRIRLDGEYPIKGQRHEHRHFAKETVVPFADGLRASMNLVMQDVSHEEISGAALHLGLARNGGFPCQARVTINGEMVGVIDLSHTQGITNYHGIEPLMVPVEYLTSGNNEILVELSETMASGDPRLVSSRLTLFSEVLYAH